MPTCKHMGGSHFTAPIRDSHLRSTDSHVLNVRRARKPCLAYKIQFKKTMSSTLCAQMLYLIKVTVPIQHSASSIIIPNFKTNTSHNPFIFSSLDLSCCKEYTALLGRWVTILRLSLSMDIDPGITHGISALKIPKSKTHHNPPFLPSLSDSLLLQLLL